jgi:hypothetical protein
MNCYCQQPIAPEHLHRQVQAQSLKSETLGSLVKNRSHLERQNESARCLTICEQTIQIQIRRENIRSTQELSAECCDEREGKGTGKL